jgi:hypothetical protein
LSDPEVIVDTVAQVGQQASAKSTTLSLLAGYEVQFHGGATALLDSQDVKTPALVDLLRDMRMGGLPVYVEMDPASHIVSRVLVPIVVKVTGIGTLPSGDLDVSLEVSHSMHFLRRSNPKFDQLVEALREAAANRSSVAVAEDDDHQIIDVRPAPPFVPSASGELSTDRLAEPELAIPAVTVTPQQATEVFALVNRQSCNPLAITATCIPFVYPDDGCWGRAHEMCRRIIARGLQPGKIWIYGRLHVQTRNKPNCVQNWTWHVAPTLQVQVGSATQTYVIDPSMFTTPVPDPIWRGAQNDAGAVFFKTDASIFYRSAAGEISTDPTYTATEQVLALFRAQLKLRTATAGPPPYANCAPLS